MVITLEMANNRKTIKDINSITEFKDEALLIAKKKIPRQIRRYFETIVESDKRSREVFDKIFFRQKIIHNINPSTECKFLDYSLKTPIMIAPMASMATMFEDGVGKMCAATDRTGSITWMAFHSREHYAKHAKINPIVYIEKPLEDRTTLLNKLKMAEQEGCIAVGIDVDSGGDRGERWGGPLKPLSVDELKKIRENLSKPFVIKGVLSVDDAVKAVDVGADIIVVSNHYGTKMDYAQAPLEVLPEIVERVGDDIDVLVDCQIRKGSDVLKVLAMGGKGVLVGRPIVWSALIGGVEGMAHLIKLMTQELRSAMLYTGVETVKNVSRDILVLPHDIFRT